MVVLKLSSCSPWSSSAAGHDERWLADDPRLAVDRDRELVERAQAVLRLAPWRTASPRALGVALGGFGLQPARACVRCSRRAYQTSRLLISAKLGHALAVLARRRSSRTSRRAAGSMPRSRIATSKLAASRLTSHSHGPGERLVEVVDVEDQAPVRCREDAEVHQVGVAARLHLDAGARRGGEVRRHDVGAAAEERERRREHASVPDRDELVPARGRLLLEQRDRDRDGWATAPRTPGCAAASPGGSPCRG